MDVRQCKRSAFLLAAAAAASAGTAAFASETIRYSYDARGRLVKVERTGPDQNKAPTTTEYRFDKADNRTLRETMNGQ